MSDTPVSDPAKFGTRQQLSQSQIDSILEMIAGDFTGFTSFDGTPMSRAPLAQKWAKIAGRDNTIQPIDVPNPWVVVGGYEGGPEANAVSEYRVLRNFRPMADLALRYQVYRNEADAAAVCRILNAFGDINGADTESNGSKLHWTEWWPILIQAAVYVQDSTAYTPALDAKLRNTSLFLHNLLQTAYTQGSQSNWIAWGLCAEFAIAGFVNNRLMHDRAIFRFRQYLREGLRSNWEVKQPNSPALGQFKNNVPIWEVYRTDHLQSADWNPPPGSGQTTTGGLAGDLISSRGNGGRGLLYSNHALNGIIMAAEWARLDGTWLYDHVTVEGSSIKGLWEEVTYQDRWSKGGPNPGGSDPAREDVCWYNVTGSAWDPQAGRGPRAFYWTRCYAYMNILQTVWPNSNGGYFISQNRYNTNSGATEVDYSLVTPTETDPDPEVRDIDYFGMRNTEFIYRRTGLWG